MNAEKYAHIKRGSENKLKNGEGRRNSFLSLLKKKGCKEVKEATMRVNINKESSEELREKTQIESRDSHIVKRRIITKKTPN